MKLFKKTFAIVMVTGLLLCSFIVVNAAAHNDDPYSGYGYIPPMTIKPWSKFYCGAESHRATVRVYKDGGYSDYVNKVYAGSTAYATPGYLWNPSWNSYWSHGW